MEKLQILRDLHASSWGKEDVDTGWRRQPARGETLPQTGCRYELRQHFCMNTRDVFDTSSAYEPRLRRIHGIVQWVALELERACQGALKNT